MPDITMCRNKDCPSSLTCYRFVARPSRFRQSYFADMKPGVSGKCGHYSSSTSEDIADFNARIDKENDWEDDNDVQD